MLSPCSKLPGRYGWLVIRDGRYTWADNGENGCHDEGLLEYLTASALKSRRCANYSLGQFGGFDERAAGAELNLRPAASERSVLAGTTGCPGGASLFAWRFHLVLGADSLSAA